MQIASQNVHWEALERSPARSRLRCCCWARGYTIVGHSEPRKYFSESDEQINQRARLQAAGLIPILCVGESDEQRSNGETERVIRRQVEQGLEGNRSLQAGGGL